MKRFYPIKGGLKTHIPPDFKAIEGARRQDPFMGDMKELRPATSRRLLDYLNPSDDQGDDTSCAVRSVNGSSECDGRLGGIVIPVGNQIEVGPTYDWVMENHYHGQDVGGMTTMDAIAGSVATKVLEEGTMLRECRSLGEILPGLDEHGPLLLPIFTTRGWFHAAENGYIDVLKDRRPVSSHMVLLVDVLEALGRRYVLIQDWQGPANGWFGCLIMEYAAFEATRHTNGPFAIVRPHKPGVYTGWQERLINAPLGDRL